MAPQWLRCSRRAHHGVAYLLAGVVVLMALVGVAVSHLLPLAERYPEQIAAWLGDRAGSPVSFDRLRAGWTRRGPLLELDNLRIGAGAQTVTIGDAEILVSQYAGLLPWRSFTELRIRKLDLILERDAVGGWQIRGLPGQRLGSDPFAPLEPLGELQIIGARLRLLAPTLDIDTVISQVDMRLRVDGQRLRAGLRTQFRGQGRVPGAPVEAVLDFNRATGSGRAWIGADRTDLGQWSALLRYAGAHVVAGQGRVQGWISLRERRVVKFIADLGLQDVLVHGAALAGEEPARNPQLRLPQVHGTLSWIHSGSGWRLDAPAVDFDRGTQAPRIRGLVILGGSHYAAAAERIDAAPLLAVAALGDRLRPELRRWLLTAAPTATLRSVYVQGRHASSLRVSARFEQTSFSSSGQAPGLRGLVGQIEGDDDGLSLQFDPTAAVTVDWPWGFGVAHQVSLRGAVAGWREGPGWRMGTRSLAVQGRHFSAATRGGLWFQGDGSRPWIDLAAEVGSAPLTAAKGFWLRNSMPPPALRWLDAALQGGVVSAGQAVVSGDLDHWPFRNRDGLFRAAAQINGAKLKFHRDWPALEDLDAEVDFIADGLRARARGATIAGIAIGAAEAGIDRFRNGVLTVDADGAADAAKMLALLRASPLRNQHGQTLANLEVAGPAQTDFTLQLPLRPGKPVPKFGGKVTLDGARLAEQRWDLAFEQVHGDATFGNEGFAAKRLAVVRDGQPGWLSLRAGSFVADETQAFEAELETSLRAADLLARAPQLGWLRDRVTGASPWTMSVTVPAMADNTEPNQVQPSRLQLRSNLIGTGLALPEPLHKPASVSLPTTVAVDLPQGTGEVMMALGDRMALRARNRGAGTGVRIALGASQVDAAPALNGLVVAGRSERFDAIEWAALARAGAGKGDALPLRSVDVTVGTLRLAGAIFRETRLRAEPVPAGISLRLDGRPLAGALQLPNDKRMPASGRFERVYWRAGAQATPETRITAAPSAADADDPADIDPAQVPPLDFAVADLRFGDAQLGAASLRTQPTAAGLRIVRLQTRAPRQAIDANGEWTRGPEGARTRLDLRLRSQDFGALLGGFGFARQMSEGRGQVRLQAQWPGNPARVHMPALVGALSLDARDGQLLQIEPGAGRMLGLLGIAQIPRRLTLDFRDFFERGFAFDTITGKVQFQAGQALSDDLAINGPAAEIRIRGAADLRLQTYDQNIDVLPRAGNLLPVAGAITGGPVGAAIGVAANAVLHKPLGQLASKTYRVTGPWKDPQVQAVSRNQAAPRQMPD